jgi:N-acetyl-anhydromuramyl-L-alanine amidase AmpD
VSEKPQGATHLENEKPPNAEIEEAELLETVAGALSAQAALVDPTDEIKLSPNYTAGWPSGAPQGVTIHTMEGYFDPSVNWLRNPVSQASAHFCVRRDGHIVQLVWERDRAWHARASGMYYFGIEHEGSGYPGNASVNPHNVPCYWTTDANAPTLLSVDKMLIESARLTAYLCTKYGIPIQHDFQLPPRRDTESYIAGHDQMMGNDHIDPGPIFPWQAYMAKVKEFAGGAQPQARTIYRVQAGAFSDRSNADALAARIRTDGFEAAIVAGLNNSRTATIYRVQAGAFSTREGAEERAAALRDRGYETNIVAYETTTVKD